MEREAEETGRPPETKLIKRGGQNSRAREQSSQWRKFALEMGEEDEEERKKRERETEGGLNGQLMRGVEGLEKTEGFPDGVSSLSLSCSPSPYFPPFFSQ